MPADGNYDEIDGFARELRQLHARRRERVISGREGRVKRTSFSQSSRAEILRKTDARCHICGGLIDGRDWEADHVLASSAGGDHSVVNYLPAHSLCNNYRWHYDAEEFQWIIKLGVWLRTQIERESQIGRAAGKAFCAHDRRRKARRRKPAA